MIVSYLVGLAERSKDLSCMKENIEKRFVYTKVLTINNFSCVLYSYQDDFAGNIYGSDDHTVALCGEIYNIEEIKAYLSIYDPSVLDEKYNHGQLISLLYTKLGLRSFSLLDGAFTILVFEHDKLIVSNDLLNQMNCYYTCQDNVFWATNEIKNLLSNHEIDLSMKPYDEYKKTFEQECYITPFLKLLQLHPNNAIEVAYVAKRIKINNKKYHDYKYEENKLDFALTMDAVEHMLESSIKNQIQNVREIGVCLSGGLDCPIVALKTREFLPNVNMFSYTVGHDDKNEFLRAKIIADIIGSRHKEIRIDKSMVQNTYLDILYNSEVLSGVDLELITIMHFLFKKASDDVEVLLTGSKSDSMFMGFFKPKSDPNEYKERFIKIAMRSRNSKNTEKFYGARHGIITRNPFFNPRLYQLCLGMAPSYKIMDGHVKYILRKYADAKTKLPKDFVWGEKVEMQIGASVNNIFSEIFNTRVSDEFSSYQEKNPHVYKLFRCLFEKRMTVAEIMSLQEERVCI